MDRKGQVLVFFVILIPLLITLAAFTIDLGYAYYQSNKLNSINHMLIKYGLNHIDRSDVRTKMIDMLYKNDKSIDSYELSISDNKISLKINKTVDSIFGKIINIKFYYLSSKYSGYIQNNRIIIEKG